MTINPDAAQHDERTTREPTELRPPEKFAHLRWHWLVPDSDFDEPIPCAWTDGVWKTPGLGYIMAPGVAAKRYAYHGPCDPADITLSLDNAAQVEVGTMALAAKHGCVSDDRPGRIEICKGNMIEGCSCRDETRAVIRALKEMKR